MRQIAALAATLCVALCGCGGSNNASVNDNRPTACTAVVIPGLEVRVTDATTGDSIAVGSTIIATDGDYMEQIASIRAIEPDASGTLRPVSYSGAAERRGTYTVRVTRPGYTAAQQSGIVVTGDECHVTTRTLNFALTPVAAQ